MPFLPLRRLAVALGLLATVAAVHADDKPLRDSIDAELAAVWQREQVMPPTLADDAAFLRRIYLDLLGTIPSYEDTKEFLADTAADRRTKLIDKLLDDPRFAQQQANVWQAVLIGRNPANQEVSKGRPVFNKWLQEKFAKNEPYDRWVRELLLAEGNSQENGPPLFYVQFSGNAENTAVNVSRILLGTQLQCAQCHDHPYDKWKQLDFYGMAGFFARLTVVDGGGGEGKRKLMIGEKRTGEVLFTGPAAQQRPGQKGQPVPARFLGGDVLEEPTLPAGFKEPDLKGGKTMPPKPDFSRKEKLADWMVAPENPYFTKAAVNRVWSQYMGRGLIHPIDDLRDNRQPSHPELFKALQQQFVARKFDLKWLTREIVASKAYQRAAMKGDGEADWYERARHRALTADEMLAALREASGLNAAIKAGDKLPQGLAEQVLRQFGDSVDGRGEFQASLAERLFMNNSTHIQQLIARRKGNLADVVLSSDGTWEEKVDRIFLTVLSRAPRAEERQRFVAHLSSDKNAAPLVEEAIWALINCSEFRFNH